AGGGSARAASAGRSGGVIDSDPEAARRGREAEDDTREGVRAHARRIGESGRRGRGKRRRCGVERARSELSSPSFASTETRSARGADRSRHSALGSLPKRVAFAPGSPSLEGGKRSWPSVAGRDGIV